MILNLSYIKSIATSQLGGQNSLKLQLFDGIEKLERYYNIKVEEDLKILSSCMLCDICIVIFEVFNINVRVWNVSKKEFEFERKNVLKHILWSTVSSSHLVSKFMIRRLLLNGPIKRLKCYNFVGCGLSCKVFIICSVGNYNFPKNGKCLVNV